MDEPTTRRRVLLGTAGVATVALSGCMGGDDGGNPDADLEEDTYGDWFASARGYEGTVDQTGNSEVTVEVGTEGGLAYTPAAVRVSTGTTVVWEWTGQGGLHNVVEEDDVFSSSNKGEEGATFTHTFDEPGVYRYVCTPHEHQGMVGAVDVVEE
ncbi:halocyanin domain-containing protein [Natronocalculus amylovorans]|uniref:Halocyanin domain-containing protein n=1 Tax=Natronocalculus amylovorans TaxID=2917812 RepID=A0AAE3KB57_9EURY|nr:halocyanin domain-containing protein [Natronocalculus amylovorans]MCL9817244.1 halocyanin domain-containing protein [Natronocalculus amylovorans]NUE02727.1 halocyanin domain-containing protein [Halorubraceae archaeon YAN]